MYFLLLLKTSANTILCKQLSNNKSKQYKEQCQLVCELLSTGVWPVCSLFCGCGALYRLWSIFL